MEGGAALKGPKTNKKKKEDVKVWNAFSPHFSTTFQYLPFSKKCSIRPLILKIACAMLLPRAARVQHAPQAAFCGTVPVLMGEDAVSRVEIELAVDAQTPIQTRGCNGCSHRR